MSCRSPFLLPNFALMCRNPLGTPEIRARKSQVMAANFATVGPSLVNMLLPGPCWVVFPCGGCLPKLLLVRLAWRVAFSNALAEGASRKEFFDQWAPKRPCTPQGATHNANSEENKPYMGRFCPGEVWRICPFRLPGGCVGVSGFPAHSAIYVHPGPANLVNNALFCMFLLVTHWFQHLYIYTLISPILLYMFMCAAFLSPILGRSCLPCPAWGVEGCWGRVDYWKQQLSSW